MWMNDTLLHADFNDVFWILIFGWKDFLKVLQKIPTATEENATNVGRIEWREFKGLRGKRLEQRHHNVCGTRNKTILSVKTHRKKSKETVEIKGITLTIFSAIRKERQFLRGIRAQ